MQKLLSRLRHGHPESSSQAKGGSTPTLECDDTDSSRESEEHQPSPERHKGARLLLHQSRAFLAKRMHCVLRSKRGWFLEIAAPALTVLILMIVVTTYPVSNSQQSMPLHPWLMANKKNIPHLETFFAREAPLSDANINQVAELYSREVVSPLGWSGTRCLPHSIYVLRPERYAFCNLNGYSPPNPPPHLSAGDLEKVQQSVNVTCSCTGGSFSCPESAVIAPPSLLLPSTDFLHNLTGYNVSDYLLKSRNAAILKRYGGLHIRSVSNPTTIVSTKQMLANEAGLEGFLNQTLGDPAAVSLGLALGAIFRDSLPPTHYATVWYHNKGWVSSTAFLNVLHNMQLRMLVTKKGVAEPETYGIAIASDPLPMADGSTDGAISGLFVQLLLEIFKSVGFILALSFVPASFASFIIQERRSGAKALQFLSGHSRFVYWTMSYFWDFCSFLVPIFIITIIFLIFDQQAYIGRNTVGPFLLLVILYGLAIIPLMYALSFMFRVPSIAFVSLLATNLMVAILTTVSVYMLELVEQDNPSLAKVKDILAKVFLVFPQFAFGRGFFEMAKTYALKSSGFADIVPTAELLDWTVLGEKFTALAIQAVLSWLGVLLIEYSAVWKCCAQRKGTRHSDEIFAEGTESLDESRDDVLQERTRVEQDPSNLTKDVVRVVGLTKYYSKSKPPAVRDLTFGVRPGECFGLLGVNGAGKTTTFNMLTTNICPSDGLISVGGVDVSEMHRSTFNELIGYCPQFDALHGNLTGFETLQLYARIRGFPESSVDDVANRLLDRMSLRPHANKPSSTYSGGNLRKLSTAVAIVGSPQVLLLDEPTSGMDPGAKRYLWEEIRRLLKTGCSVVLTSHSMEECEALCNRLAIMVDGQFQCFGTVANLKQRFGEGYMIEVDLVDEATVDPASLFESESIRMTECVGKRCNFEANGTDVKLSWLFKHLVGLQTANKVSTFAVRQASLDDVFVNFVRRYEPEAL